MDEILMFMAMLPFIGVFFRKIHVWWHSKFKHKEHEKVPYLIDELQKCSPEVQDACIKMVEGEAK
jgi:hypothetical protein